MTSTVPDAAPAVLDADERAELEALRALRDDLARPVLTLCAELAHLRDVAHVARKVVDRGAKHRSLGYDRIRVGALDELRGILATSPRYVTAAHTARPTLDELRAQLRGDNVDPVLVDVDEAHR